MKKFFSGLLIGAFVFGIGAMSVQPVNAASDKFGQMRDGNSYNRPTPPTDSDGKPMQPPDNGDNSNRPTPPTDSDGKPMPPPDNGDNSNRPTPPTNQKHNG